MSNIPKVSVLMPVYNASSFLKESIDSILSQSFTDFEFLIINDGSTDPSANIIDSYTDYRIKHIKFPVNGGITKALNIGLDIAQGEYIARMDADDLALPQRLEKQVMFMDQNPDVGVSGTWVEYFGKRKGVMMAPQNHKEILWTLLFGSPFFHPSVIMRTKLIREIKYPSDFPHAEDYGLWMELVTRTRFANIPEPLLKYRWSLNSVGAVYSSMQNTSTSIIRKKMTELLSGEKIGDEKWNRLDTDSNESMDLVETMDMYNLINQKQKLFGPKEIREKIILLVKKILQKKGLMKKDSGLFFKMIFSDITFIKYYFRHCCCTK